MALVIADKIMQAWADAGIVDDINTIRRFVVDFQCGHVPIIYIERIGDDKLLSVTQTLEGVEISRDPDLAEARRATIEALTRSGVTPDEAAEHVRNNPI